MSEIPDSPDLSPTTLSLVGRMRPMFLKTVKDGFRHQPFLCTFGFEL